MGVPRFDPDPAADNGRAGDGGEQGEGGSGRLRVAAQGKHQRMAVDDAGRRRQQRAGAPQRRFEAFGLGARQKR
jgi:hypothetical protein